MTAIQSIDCPYCAAPAGTPCHTAKGKPALEHFGRRLLAFTAAQTPACVNCGEPLIENGTSPTDYFHAATRRTRCDGRTLDRRRAGAPLAIPESSRP